MALLGEKKLGEYPEDYHVYKLSYALHKLPDEIRNMPIDDFLWMLDLPIAEAAAIEEGARRVKPDENQD